MSKPCVCDSVYGAKGSNCEPATKFICDAIPQLSLPTTFYRLGQPIDLSEAIEEAAVLLSKSRYPLFTGIERLGIKAQQSVVDLCRKVNGVIDLCSSNQNRSSSSFSLAREGQIEATMGEVINRSQALLVFNCNPGDQQSRFVQQLRESSRAWFWIGQDQPPDHCANWLRVGPSDLDNLLLGFQGIIQNAKISCRFDAIEFESSSVGQPLSVIFENWLEQWSALNHLTVIHDSRAPDPEFDFHGDCLTAVVRGLNRHCHAVSIDVASRFNYVGAKNVLAWSTGFPHATDFSKGFPTSYGLEFSTANVVGRQEADLIVDFAESQEASIEGSVPRIFLTPGDFQSSATKLMFCGLNFLDDTFMRFDGSSFELALENGSKLSVAEAVKRIASNLQSTC